jgi:hypothetical protein
VEVVVDPFDVGVVVVEQVVQLVEAEVQVV